MTNDQWVVIGYGNTLRRDDGVGQVVAMEVQEWGCLGVRSLSLHQLTPELAQTLATVEGAIFVDAYPVSGETATVQVFPLRSEDADTISVGHHCDPRSLLALAQALYDHSPSAWLVTIPAVDFEFGETLSPIAQQGVTDALLHIHRLLAIQAESPTQLSSGCTEMGQPGEPGQPGEMVS
jgi:hydrogenase maturation protease